MQYVYEQGYFLTGWVDKSGLTPPSWWDHDLTSTNGAVINIMIVELPFLDDPDVIFTMPPIKYEILPSFFVNQNIIFVPMSVRALGPPDQMLKNEVRRRR